MKSGAVLSLAFVLASVSPGSAQNRQDAVLASAPSTGVTAGQADANPAPWRMAQATTGTAPAQPSTEVGPDSPKKAKRATASKPRRQKKTASDEPAHRSGAAIVKEGGQTCSGLDQYRVCW